MNARFRPRLANLDNILEKRPTSCRVASDTNEQGPVSPEANTARTILERLGIHELNIPDNGIFGEGPHRTRVTDSAIQHHTLGMPSKKDDPLLHA